MRKRTEHKIRQAGLAVLLACSVIFGSGQLRTEAAAEEMLTAEEGTSALEENSLPEELLPKQSLGEGGLSLEQSMGEEILLLMENNGEEEPSEEMPEEMSEEEERTEEASEEMPEEEERTEEAPEEMPEEEEQTEEPGENHGEILILQAEPDLDTARAGSRLLYTVTAENRGECTLEDLKFFCSLEEELSGIWEDTEGNPLEEQKGMTLEPGMSRTVYLSIPLPEDRTEPVDPKLSVSAVYGLEESGEKTVEITAAAEGLQPVPVTPLQADFQVTKTADRQTAVAGDQVFFQICIRNTGQRTLHSVLTTEKFQLGSVPVEFLEKEGVILNQAKTKALVAKLEPGHSISLRAAVTIPASIQDSRLTNEVEVVTEETGNRVVASKAEIQIHGSKPEEEPDIPEKEQPEEEMEAPVSKARPVSVNPKTGDSSRGTLWGEIWLLSAAGMGILWRKYRQRETKH